jgi:predicted transcriptional regulator
VIAMKNDATRNERLKAALRDNLKRRKAQTRVRGQATAAAETGAAGERSDAKPDRDGGG